MRKLLTLWLITTVALLGCGGSDDTLVNTDVNDPVDPTVPPVALLAKLNLLTDSPQIPSDGALPATITAQVQDADNNFVSDVIVSFAADSGGLAVTQGTTDEAGRALATLETAGDPTNRTIMVTGSVIDVDGTVLTDTVSVAVIGSTLSISGPDTLVQGDTRDYTIRLADANDEGIPGETVEISSNAGNVLSATSIVTDSAGAGQITLTATVAGSDTLTAMALGLASSTTLSVSDDSFAFVNPAANKEIDLNTSQLLRVRWTQGGTPIVGQSIDFATTRGVLSATSTITDASGEASTNISASNAGAAQITAATTGGPTTTLPVEFVATQPVSIEVQADPFNIAPSEQATVTAVVRDPNNNLVKNQRIVFELDDVTGGSLSVGSATTDSQGRAQTFYTASSSTSASGGVTITAFVQNAPTVTDSTNLTVARREVFISLGTGNELSEPNTAQYSIEYAIQVTDADGNGVGGVEVQTSILSVNYFKGIWVANLTLDQWVAEYRATCPDEDINRNGLLDPGEDLNASGQLEAGNIALVTPNEAITDDTGTVLVNVVYQQVYGIWLETTLDVKTRVQGTEFTEGLSFILPVIASDVDSLETAPPGLQKGPDEDNGLPNGGLVSPFGYSDDCGNTI